MGPWSAVAAGRAWAAPAAGGGGAAVSGAGAAAEPALDGGLRALGGRPGRLGGGGEPLRRGHLHRLWGELAQPARHAAREVGEGHVAQRRHLKPAGGQQLVGGGGPHPAHGDEQVEAVHLRGADPARHLARALAQVALDAVGLLRLLAHGGQDPVLVHAAVAQEELGAVGHGEEGEELVRAGELLVHAARDVLGLGQHLRELHRLEDWGGGHAAPDHAISSAGGQQNGGIGRAQVFSRRGLPGRERAGRGPANGAGSPAGQAAGSHASPRASRSSSSSPRKCPTSWSKVTRSSSTSSARSRTARSRLRW